jgi:hypothetical protein
MVDMPTYLRLLLIFTEHRERQRAYLAQEAAITASGVSAASTADRSEPAPT